MRICIISAGVGGLPLPPVNGGAVENLIDIYLRFNEHNFKDDITVYSCFNQKAIDKSKNYKYTRFIFIKTSGVLYKVSKGIRYLLNHFLKLKIGNAYISNVRLKGEYDVVLVENRPDYGYIIKKRVNCPVCLHLHNDIVDTRNLYYRIDDETFDKIICVSDFIKKIVNRQLPNSPSYTLYNCVNIDAFQPNSFGEAEVKSFREQYGISAAEKVILFPGRINKEKGIKQLIESFMRLPSDINCKLLIVGSSIYGKTNNDKFTEELKKMAYQAKERIVFTGYMPYDKMPLVYASSDVIVIPSIWDDPSPLTAYESLSTGKPLIVSDSGGIVEIVKYSSAFIVKRGEGFVEALTKELVKCLNSDVRLYEKNLIRSKSFSIENYCNLLRGFLLSK